MYGYSHSMDIAIDMDTDFYKKNESSVNEKTCANFWTPKVPQEMTFLLRNLLYSASWTKPNNSKVRTIKNAKKRIWLFVYVCMYVLCIAISTYLHTHPTENKKRYGYGYVYGYKNNGI